MLQHKQYKQRGCLLITKEKAIELALENHEKLRLLETKINALQSQINYIENDELKNEELPSPAALSTDIEFFIEQHPDSNKLGKVQFNRPLRTE